MPVLGIRKGASFRALQAGSDIRFSTCNIIYGVNGSGKTSLSEMLRRVDQAEVAQNLDLEASPQAYVFNSEYVERELREFTTGESGARSIAIGHGDISLQIGKNALEAEIKSAQQVEVNLQAILKGVPDDKQIGEGAKRSVLEKLAGVSGFTSFQYKNDRGLISKIENSAGRLNDDVRLRSLSVIHSAPPALVEVDLEKLSGVADLIDSCFELVAKNPRTMGLELADLEEVYRDWLKEGLRLFSDHNSASDQPGCCPFCVQLVPPPRLGALQETFDSESATLVREIDLKLKRVEGLYLDIKALHETIQTYSALESPYEPDLKSELASMAGWLEDALAALDGAATALKTKRGTPTASWTGSVLKITAHNGERLKNVVDRHNSSCDSHAENVNRSVALIEGDCLSHFREELLTARARRAQIERAKAAVNRRRASRARALETLRAQMSNKRESAERINEVLQVKLDVSNVCLEVSSDELSYFLVRRDGNEARHLSEGERQAISLAYFVQSLDGDGVRPTESIVVFDDPVVAMDEHRTNVALFMLRDAAEKFSQVFFSTHSFQVLKQAVKVWGSQDGLDCSYFEMRKTVSGSCSIVDLPHRYLEFPGEYHYLFSRMAGAAFGDDSFMSFDVRNVARRVLESFLEFQAPVRNASLRAMLEHAWQAEGNLESYVPLIRGAVATFNSGSHSVSAASSQDEWSFPRREDIRLCYGIIMLLNQRHARSMLESTFPPAEYPEIHAEARRYANLVTGVQKRLANGAPPGFEAMLPTGSNVS